jgi:hypothetical protein
LDGVAFKKDLAPFVTWTALEQALNRREVNNEANDSAEHETCVERPGTAPVSPSPHNVMVDKDHPRTSMSPKQFTVVRNNQ